MATNTAVDVVMPQMGVSVSEGTITKWSKQVGDTIEADETRSGGRLSRMTLKRSAELRRLLFETRVEAIIAERAAGRELRPV